MGMVDEALEYLRGVAEELGLEEDEAESFIDSGMSRKGFRKVSSWADPEPEEGGGGGGDFFSKKAAKKAAGHTRPVGKQTGTGFAQYGN